MTSVYIGIGTNMGDRTGHMDFARRELGRLPKTRLAAFSGVYETEPVGPVPQGPFLNAAAKLVTTLDPYDLLDALHAIEARSGRGGERVRWGPRTLDLDILLYGDRVISSDELVIPHPMMHERWFVLRPLADLDASAVHPALEMTVGELLSYVEQGVKQ